MKLQLFGTTAKDSQYLKRIKDAIEGDKDHPRNRGVKMQAHHIISGEGMRLSGLGQEIEKFGYDINLLPNLVFIPCTLPGACHLGVQPHRGNHTANVDQDDYQDDLEPEDYHSMVARRVRELHLPLQKECEKGTVDEIASKLDKLSHDILGLIQKAPGKAPLTDIAKHFGPRGVGCGGRSNILPGHGVTPCPCNRDHQQPPDAKSSRNADKRAEVILLDKPKAFELKPGK
jgi:hypothetical protein